MLIRKRLEEAFDKKNNDLNNYIWKGEKIRNGDNVEQKKIRLVDCSIDQLEKYYQYCDKMLNNTNKKTPGRKVLLEILKDQSNRCNAELFLRWLFRENQISKYSFLNIIRTFLENNPNLDRKTLVLDNIVGKCPYEYKDIPIDIVMDGCMDTLGLYKRKYITTAFLLRQGVWPSSSERKEFSTNGKINTEKILEYLEVNPKHKLRINSKGLSLEQMKAVTTLKTKKYSEMSTLQLETLRNRIFIALEREINYHIHQWENLQYQITRVLESKGVVNAII